MRAVRLVLLLDVLAAASSGVAVVLGLGVPLAGVGRLTPGHVTAVAVLAGVAVVAVGGTLLLRAVARPVERVLSAAARLGEAGGGAASLPILGPLGGPLGGSEAASLAHVAVAFERVVSALEEERERLAAKRVELERAQGALAEARASWVRSERLAALGRLASGLAHEVGNPLGAISGFAALAQSRIGPEASDLGALLARIEAEAARIDRLVRDMLDFARPTVPRCVPVALRPVVESALRLAQVQSRFQAVEVELELPDDLPALHADEARLAQVFLNLFLNAGDAMEGRGSLRVEAARDGERVEIQIFDGGPGIAPEHLPRIFDPFFTTKAPGAGTGLGLAVCHRLVEDMGGRIEAANAPGGGAVFRLWLPSAERGAPPASGRSDPGAC